MNPEEIRAKLALTDKQRELVEKLNATLDELKENHVGIIFDSCTDSLSFAAFNDTEVLEIDNKEVVLDEENAVDVEDYMEWGNVFASIYEYDNYYSRLHAVFGCKSKVNESMMSAAL